MAFTIDQFGKALAASGLMTADEVRAVWSGFPADARPKTAEAFAQALIEKRLLTDFQAKQLLAGRGNMLVMGDYVILAEIGAGGMGQVYKAKHRRMERIVALKVMSSAAMKDEAAVKRFQREVKAAAKLEHPNIVTAYDSGEAGKVKYLVMQFVDGGDLSTLVKTQGPLPIERAVDFVVQTARGLAFAHGEGVIHRDIKPANLLLDKKGVVKILDMGLARIESGDDGLTATEQVMGTVDYMSPEQAANTKQADSRADIYSLGCTLWFLLTGSKAYEGDTMIARLMAHRDGPLPSLVKTRDDAPWALEQVLHKMIAKRPQDRYQSMEEVSAALEPFAGGSRGGGSGSSLGAGTQTSAELAAFLQSVGPKPGASGTHLRATKTAMAPKSSTTVGPEATASFIAAGEETDPQSPITPQAKPLPKPGSRPVKKRNPSLALIAGGIGVPAIALVAGLIITINGNDDEVATLETLPGAAPTAATVVRPRPQASVAIAPGSPTPATSSSTPSARDFALQFDGGQGAVTISNLRRDDDGPFTLECWVRNPSSSTMPVVRVNGRAPIQLHFHNRQPHGAERNEFDKIGRDAVGPQLAGDQWTHLAYVVSPGESRLFVNGKSVNVQAKPTPGMMNSAKFGDGWIGTERFDPGVGSTSFTGEIDELRVSKVARYTAAGFVPARRFEADADAVALYHFNEGSGDRLHDASRNALHGRIINANWTEGVSAPASPITTTNVAEGDWRALFNGRDLTGWRQIGRQGWTVEGGELVGRTQAEPGFLLTDSPWNDFELDFEYRLAPESNSGVFLRAWPEGYVTGKDFHEIQLLDDTAPRYAGVRPEARNGSIYNRVAAKPTKQCEPNVWHHMTIAAYGDRVRVNLDGEQVVDGALRPGNRSSGGIGLQLHSHEIRFRNLRAHPLNADGTPQAAPQAAEYALQFDGREAHVALPFGHDADGPLTIEASLRCGPVSSACISNTEAAGFALGTTNGVPGMLVGRRVAGAAKYAQLRASEPLGNAKLRRVAAVYDGKKSRLFVDGKLATSADCEGEYSPSAHKFFIGGSPEGAGIDYPFTGVIDEVRFSKTARYTADYVPAARLDADADTIALYHCDAGAGDALTDDSGHGRHGRISARNGFESTPRPRPRPVRPTMCGTRFSTAARSTGGKSSDRRDGRRPTECSRPTDQAAAGSGRRGRSAITNWNLSIASAQGATAAWHCEPGRREASARSRTSRCKSSTMPLSAKNSRPAPLPTK